MVTLSPSSTHSPSNPIPSAPIYCNVTVGLGSGAICGGEGAAVNIEDASRGLDVGRDYCSSGEFIRDLGCACSAHCIATVGMATQNGSQYWLCAPGPDTLSPLPTTPTANTSTSPTNLTNPTTLPISNVEGNKSKLIGPIVGGIVGGLLLSLALFWWSRYRKRIQDRGLYRIDAWKDGDDSQGPSPLLHRRGMSEQSNMTTRTSQSTATTQSHITPYSAERSPESMRSPIVSGPAKFALIQERLNADAAAAASPSTETSENSDMLSQDSHVPLMRKTSAGPDTPLVPSLIASVPTPPEDVHFVPPPVPPIPSNIPLPASPPAVSFVTSPSRSRHRPKSRNPSTSSLPTRSRIHSTSAPPPPDSPPISTDDVEQRLLELRNEAERGLAEIRAQRGVSLIGEMPPPYHLP